MASRNDVSKSLDMIGNQEGFTLVRGPTHWEAKEGGGSSTYNGACLYRTTAWGVNTTIPSIIPWQAVEHDTDNWADIATYPDGFKIPFGVGRVVIDMQIRCGSHTSGDQFFFRPKRNGDFWPLAQPIVFRSATNANAIFNLTTRPLDVAQGDQISLQVEGTDSSMQIGTDFSYFAIHAVG